MQYLLNRAMQRRDPNYRQGQTQTGSPYRIDCKKLQSNKHPYKQTQQGTTVPHDHIICGRQDSFWLLGSNVYFTRTNANQTFI